MLVPVVMGRKSLFFITVFLFVLLMEGSDRAVVVDSVTRQPLPSASVFDKNGNVAGITDSKEGCHIYIPRVSRFPSVILVSRKNQ